MAGSEGALEIRLLGGLSIRSRLDGHDYQLGKKASALLAILALAPDRPVPRDKLAGLLWSATPDTLAKSSLRQTLGIIRRVFDENCDGFLDIGRHTVALRQSAILCDVAKFKELLAADRLSDAVALY